MRIETIINIWIIYSIVMYETNMIDNNGKCIINLVSRNIDDLEQKLFNRLSVQELNMIISYIISTKHIIILDEELR